MEKKVGCSQQTGWFWSTRLQVSGTLIFRVAISNRRILELRDGMVTFQYKESDTGKFKTRTVIAEEFIRRFLQHVLPKRFVKVRYYGIWSPNKRHLLNKAKELLGVTTSKKEEECETNKNEAKHFCCPKCGGVLVMIENLQPKKRRPP